MLIGYRQNKKAHKLWDFEPGGEIMSLDIAFDEFSPAALKSHDDSCKNEKNHFQVDME